MENAQDVYALPTHAVRDQVGCSWNHQLTCARHAACTPKFGMVGEQGYRVFDALNDAACCLGVVLGDVIRFFLKIA